MPSPTLLTPIQILSITTALLSSGGIATLSLFDIPELQSQPASRSLPSIRWLFSRGSHIFPSAAVISSAGFAVLTYAALPAPIRAQALTSALLQLLKVASNNARVNGYIAASALTLSIGPFTSLMIPTNFRLIEMCEAKGGSRSAKAEKEGGEGRRSVEESIGGKDQPGQFTDLSGPQTRTEEGSSVEEDEEVRVLLGRFGRLNLGRALLMGMGGVVGLWAALL